MESHFYSHGKLLITGEYLVLDGAQALAIPTKYGQDLVVTPIKQPIILWKSINELGEIWFELELSLDIFNTASKLEAWFDSADAVSRRLVHILKQAQHLNAKFLNDEKGYTISTHQDFNSSWGLGTSSTLINNIAQWAHIDAFQLSDMTFGGSGYDIACAQHSKAILYQVKGIERTINTVSFDPAFSNHLYFVHLKQKQNSREAIKKYQSKKHEIQPIILRINALSKAILECNDLPTFQKLLDEHEQLIGNVIEETPIKERLFSDFNGSMKSLGAWGGDFVLVASEDNPESYFKSKGFDTIIPYNDMIL